ncbi:putative quinol monooxygenase [Streptomyces sp. NPDC088116]|uniref:putative quinol monooxygenase n=1 Tax=Streptomyces sp. NPDC088116 TaxID=3365825 RepID=UPI0037F46FF0
MSRFRSFLLVRPAPGHVHDALDFFREREIIEAAFPYGVLSGKILVPETDPEDFMVTSLWGDDSGYERWCASAERAAFLSSVLPLLAAEDALTGWTGPDTGSPGEEYRPGTPLRVAHDAVARPA